MTTNYPLAWPVGWPRTDPAARRPGNFAQNHAPITTAKAIRRIMKQLNTMDGPGQYWNRISEIVIYTNLETRKSDGLPYSNRAEPKDPGAALYFTLSGKDQCIPCDTFTTVAQNLAGIAATLDALRALERYGSGIMEKAFTGFEALPNLDVQPWWVVLGVPQDSEPHQVKLAYHRLRSLHHTDNGGDAVQFDRVIKAWRLYCASVEQ